ncbi:bacteriocin-like protein [Chryseobacterium sp. YIM B08800]|uniref:bacteriocin-like protein n=1 Tax=Chryseobacterium sp. YIM B08800 TaxID=2984136 RepID=UPI003A0FF5B0
MKNLKKLNKSQLKTIKGSGINPLPEPDFCMYYCNGVIICATCSDDFKCPDDSM